jgi:hypothetical protein
MLRIRIRIILGSRIRIRIKVESWILHPYSHQSEKQVLDLDLHQCEKVEVLECHFLALKGTNSGKSEG